MTRLAITTSIHTEAARHLHRDPSFANDLPPPLKWAGGKRWQVPRLQPLWQRHRSRRLVEPFCGGMAITLGLAPDRALLNDINPHVVNFYTWLKRGLTIRIPLKNDRSTYNLHRDRFNLLIETGRSDTAEAAALFYYLNRTGYNGLCRFNRRGGFNVPFGSHKVINYRVEFDEYQERLRRYHFTNVDFEDLPIRPDDFIYADPPYDVEFTQYAPAGFTWDDQVRTALWLAQHPGPVALSNQATRRIVALYKSLGFVLYFVDAPRMISCNGDRKKAREVLAVKNM